MVIPAGAIEKALFEPMKVLSRGTFTEHEGLVMFIDRKPPFFASIFGSVSFPFFQAAVCPPVGLALGLDRQCPP
jgi:hypothetical protein